MSSDEYHALVEAQSSEVSNDSIESNSDTIECISSDTIEFSSDSYGRGEDLRGIYSGIMHKDEGFVSVRDEIHLTEYGPEGVQNPFVKYWHNMVVRLDTVSMMSDGIHFRKGAEGTILIYGKW